MLLEVADYVLDSSAALSESAVNPYFGLRLGNLDFSHFKIYFGRNIDVTTILYELVSLWQTLGLLNEKPTLNNFRSLEKS